MNMRSKAPTRGHEKSLGLCKLLLCVQRQYRGLVCAGCACANQIYHISCEGKVSHYYFVRFSFFYVGLPVFVSFVAVGRLPNTHPGIALFGCPYFFFFFFLSNVIYHTKYFTKVTPLFHHYSTVTLSNHPLICLTKKYDDKCLHRGISI
jgi:hypothetical protein